MRRWMMLQAVCLIVLTTTVVTTAQEPHVRARARQYEPYMAAAAARHGIDPSVLWTIAYLETRFQPGLISPKGARGLMQFMPGTAARYGLTNPLDPIAAIDSAARYVRFLSERFGGRVDLVLAGYNAGEGAVEAFRDGRRLVLQSGKIINSSGIRTGGVPPYRETQGYVAGGTAIYQNISATGIFSQTRRVRAPAPPQSAPLPGHAAPDAAERSLYMTSPAIPAMTQESKKSPTVSLTNPPTSARIEPPRSIYMPSTHQVRQP